MPNLSIMGSQESFSPFVPMVHKEAASGNGVFAHIFTMPK